MIRKVFSAAPGGGVAVYLREEQSASTSTAWRAFVASMRIAWFVLRGYAWLFRAYGYALLGCFVLLCAVVDVVT